MSSRDLQSVYLFKTLSADEMGALAAIGQTQPFGMGDTIFMKGDAAKALYFIKLGTIKIQQSSKTGDNIDVATLSAGSHFGEMAFVDDQPRSATAVASDRGELITISYDKLQALLVKSPNIAVKFYRELSHFLCTRLRVTTNDLSFNKEKNLSHF